jgi:hypothetical protein
VQKPTLVGIYTKMVRAYQHLDALNDAVERFAMSSPHVPVIEQDRELDGIQIRCSIAEAPPEFAVLSGEIVQTVREVLDHLAWQLVIDAGEKPQPRERGKLVTQFPILTEQPRQSGNGRLTAARIHPRVSDPAAALVDWLQPYTPRPDLPPFDPKQHHLAVLADLSNTDKHQTLHVAITHITDPHLFWETERGRFDMGPGLFRGRFPNGAPITRLVRSVIPTEPNVQVGMTATSEVAIEVPGGSIVPVCRDEDRPGLMSIDELPNIILGTTILPLIGTMTNL